MSEEMFNEAVQAAKAGQRQRAKDLIGRLLKTEPNNVGYWLWMSSVVDTEKEQIFCLQKALKIDPNTLAARQGLVILGAMSPEEAALPPPQPIEARSVLLPDSGAARGGLQEWLERPRNRQIALIGGLGMLALIIVGGIFFGLIAPRLWPQRQVVVVTSTPTASNTPLPTGTPTVTPPASPVPSEAPCSLPRSPSAATPLAVYLCLTQTPTVFPVPTEQSISEDFNTMARAYVNGEWDRVLSRADVVTGDPQFSDNAKVYFYIAEAYRFTGKLADAQKNYTSAIGRNAAFAAAYWGRAQVQFARNRPTDALDDLERAIQADPAFYLPLLDRAAYYGTVAGNFGRELADLQQAQTFAPDNALVLAQLAVSLINNGQPEAAQQTAEQALALDPGQPVAYYARGRARLALGSPQAALADLQVSVPYLLDATSFARLFPLLDAFKFVKFYQANVLYHYGLALAASGQSEAAISVYTQALGLFSNLTLALVARGEVYLAAAEYESARADFNSAVGKFQQSDANNPRLIDAYLGNGLSLLGLKRPDSALSNFQLVVRSRPESFEGQFGLGRSLVETGKPRDALPTLELALALAQTDGQRARVLLVRAQAFQALGQPATEVADWQALLALPGAQADVVQTAAARLTAIGPLPTDTSTSAPPTETVPASATPTAGAKPSATPTGVKPSASPTGARPTATPTRAARASATSVPARPTATQAPTGYPAGATATSTP